ncbi:MAG: hypothetical protein RBR19_04055 [Sedimentisphaerales bacterium]|nr:hypothetical protein [Sedimentisphaerales bacterium]NLT77952.1 hypothetical protein [Planctomycetota bacterium]
MCVQARRPIKPFLLIVLLLVACGTVGCRCSDCEGARCVPRSPWQSPTIQVTRSLLLVNRDELRILYIDGHDASPTCVSVQGVQEYHLLPGWHTLTAVFRYPAPPSEGVLADVNGQPLTLEHEFLAGHEYVAVYREHEGPTPQAEFGVADAATNVLNPPQLYWTLDAVDVADASMSLEPEVADAQSYLSWVKDTPGVAKGPEDSSLY